MHLALVNFHHVECKATEIDIKKEICLHVYCIYKKGYGLLNTLSFKFVKLPGVEDRHIFVLVVLRHVLVTAPRLR